MPEDFWKIVKDAEAAQEKQNQSPPKLGKPTRDDWKILLLPLCGTTVVFWLCVWITAERTSNRAIIFILLLVGIAVMMHNSVKIARKRTLLEALERAEKLIHFDDEELFPEQIDPTKASWIEQFISIFIGHVIIVAFAAFLNFLAALFLMDIMGVKL